MNSSDFTFPVTLPEVTFADADPAKIIARMTADYEREAETTLYPADPVRLDLNATAYEFSVAYALLDTTGKMNLLYYATGDFLDHIGAFHKVTRLGAKPATIEIQRFEAEPGLEFPVQIPAGIRVGPDRQTFFKTLSVAVIPAATTPAEKPYVDVVVECVTPGESGNGFLPGQVTTIVDPLPNVASTVNITESLNGADIEKDGRYRRRIYIAPEGFSTAGPEGAYKFFALSAHQNIEDVAVTSPLPCYISVHVMMQNGGEPDSVILRLVEDALSPRDVRPMGDRVTVSAREEVTYVVSGTFYLDAEDKPNELAIRAAVQNAGVDYVAWQKAELGRDIEPDELRSRVRSAGAKHLILTSPEYTAVPETSVSVAASITLVFGGYDVPEDTGTEGAGNG